MQVSHTVSDRISSSWSNTGKKKWLADHFDAVRAIKNRIAQYCFQHLHALSDKEFATHGYQWFRDTLSESERSILTAWELQKIFDLIRKHTSNHVTRVLTNRRFVVGRWDAKKRRVYRQSSDLSLLLNGLRFRSSPQELTDRDIPKGLRKTWNRFCSKFGRDRLVALLTLHQENVSLRLRPAEYASGSYIKAAQFSKASKKPVWHSHWLRDDDNRLYQDWYRFATPTRVLYLPLAVNHRFHNKDYDLRKEHAVTLNDRGEINVSLAYERTDAMLPVEKIVALDLNVKTNLLASSTGLLFGLEEQWLEKHSAAIQRLEKKGYQNLDDSDLQELRGLVRHRESTLRQKISEVLHTLHAQGVTDLVVESLSLTLGGGDSRRMNRILRFLRFGTIRTWLREQAHKLGMRIHDLPAAYSSQACACGHVEYANRPKQEDFCCRKCGEKAPADPHAAENLLWLFVYGRDVLVRQGFLEQNTFGEWVTIAREMFRYKELKSVYESRKTGVSRIQGGVFMMGCPTG